MDKIKKELITNQVIRVILSFIVLFGFNLPLFMKILLIIIFDFTDVLIPFYVSENDFDLYQKYDKVGDIFIYTAIWFYYIQFISSPGPLKLYITFLYIFRLFGYLIYYNNGGDHKIFVIFPNLFLESLFVISFLEFLGYPFQKYFYLYVGLLILTVFFKIIQELYIHTNVLNIFKN